MMINIKNLQQQIDQHFQELVDETDKARVSDEMLQYLEFCACFHAYSPNNVWLIMLARPNATHVAGFQAWKHLGRWVRKGERGIPIFAPLIYREKDEASQEVYAIHGFKIVYVFDVQQTEGQPLPPQPDWKSPEKSMELNRRLIQYAESQGISVVYKDLPNEIQGLSKGRAIEIDHLAGTKTLVHEIVHELLHQGEREVKPRALKELEAESVAFIVSRHLGLENLNSPNYIALNGISKEEMISHMNIIQSMANKLIKGIEQLHDRA